MKPIVFGMLLTTLVTLALQSPSLAEERRHKIAIAEIVEEKNQKIQKYQTLVECVYKCGKTTDGEGNCFRICTNR